MDPATLALLAKLGLGGGSAILGPIQGIVGSLANNPQQKRNREQLDELLTREKAGTLGLTGDQRQVLDQQLNAPVAAAAQQARSRAEAIQAAAGSGASGADLSRLRTEQSRTQALGAQNAAAQIGAADLAAQQQQKNEIEQRTALKSALRADDYNQIFAGLAQGAETAGSVAGVPGMTKKSTAQFTPQEQDTLTSFMRNNPDDPLVPIIQSLLGGA